MPPWLLFLLPLPKQYPENLFLSPPVGTDLQSVPEHIMKYSVFYKVPLFGRIFFQMRLA
jgi:hypothetical protein